MRPSLHQVMNAPCSIACLEVHRRREAGLKTLGSFFSLIQVPPHSTDIQHTSTSLTSHVIRVHTTHTVVGKHPYELGTFDPI